MSLCDKCHAPGACCKGFMLEQLAPVCAPIAADALIANAQRELEIRGLSFFVFDSLDRSELHPDRVGILWRCTRLGPDGRCTDYENRPPTCVNYQPMDDRLCVIRPFKGIPILVEHA